MVLVCTSVAALVALACPEQPQNPAPTAAVPASATIAKHAAIIGAPSALQQMLVQQAGTAPAAPAATQQGSLSPAAGTVFQARPAVIQHGYSSPSIHAWTPASPDRPDIFGSSAMPIAHTPLDAKWRRVTVSFSSAVPVSRQLPQADGDDAMAKIQLVNSWVNRRIQFVNDIRSSGKSDLWSGAAETLSRGQGDCEDYAITKLQILKAFGFSSDDLYLAVVKDTVRRADHAILVVRIDGRFVVLDNNVDRVLDAYEVADYRPIITYAASGKAWLHGYRQPVQLASAQPAAAPTTAN